MLNKMILQGESFTDGYKHSVFIVPNIPRDFRNHPDIKDGTGRIKILWTQIKALGKKGILYKWFA